MDCRNQFIAGVPKKGFHAARFLGISLNDTLGTIMLAYLSARYYNSSVIKHFVYWFIIGQIFHFLFCVDTSVILALKNVLL